MRYFPPLLGRTGVSPVALDVSSSARPIFLPLRLNQIAFFLLIACALIFSAHAEPLFDRVVAKGKGFEIKSSQLEDTYILFKANRVAVGSPVPQTPEDIKKTESEILNTMIAAKVILARATEADRTNSVDEAEKFIKERKDAAGSDAAYRRQLIISGVKPEDFEKEVREQAIIQAIVNRELRPKQVVTDEDIEKYYKENPKMFQEPEKWKIAHIFMGIRNRATREEISDAEKAEKRAKMKDILVRARAGVDFAKLAKENSEHGLTKDNGGEQTIVRDQMPPEFEAAVLSMKPGQISDIVTTGLGWHIIKFIEYIPPKTVDLASSKEKIKAYLLNQATQRALADWVKELRKEANVEVTL
jgi:parvulin-like peptidyl-prolyl isomerase